MIADAELLKIIHSIFGKLNLGKYTIKVSHRRLLDAMVELAGIGEDKFKSVCSSVDKLDKQPWKEIQTELIDKKGLTQEQCEKLEKMVQLKGDPFKLIAQIRERGVFEGHVKGLAALDEMEVMFRYCEAMGCLSNMEFDLSLARGLDYYTGMI
jgi:histidyl-tRNA synthetase